MSIPFPHTSAIMNFLACAIHFLSRRSTLWLGVALLGLIPWLGAGAVPAEPRTALVIGNGAYKGASPLKNPVNDAVAVGKRLVDIGFEVRTETDVTAEKMLRALSDFTQALTEAAADGRPTAAVVFYAGHGVQVDGENYLCLLYTSPSPRD